MIPSLPRSSNRRPREWGDFGVEFAANEQNLIHLPRQCLRNGKKFLISLGFLGKSVEFTSMVDVI